MPESNLDKVREELIRSRGFIRGAETQLTKALDELDLVECGDVTEPTPDPDPDPEPTPDPAPDPDPIDPRELRSQEPSGWNPTFDADMNYSGITTTQHPYFSINDSPLEGVWPTQQADLFSADALSFLQAEGSHVARFLFPQGLNDGQRSAMMRGPLRDNSIGVYLAYTMRLSANWEQGGVGSVNGVKHTEIRTTGGVLARTNIGRELSEGTRQYTIRFNHVGVGQIPRTNVEQTRFAPNEWITVQALLQFNGTEAGTGSMSVWVNGILAGRDATKDITKPGQIAIISNLNVFGGGIGNVPNDQFIDIGHFYASTP